MSRPLTLEENLQVRLPAGTKARMKARLPTVAMGAFWRMKILNWLDGLDILDQEPVAREARGDGE